MYKLYVIKWQSIKIIEIYLYNLIYIYINKVENQSINKSNTFQNYRNITVMIDLIS